MEQCTQLHRFYKSSSNYSPTPAGQLSNIFLFPESHIRSVGTRDLMLQAGTSLQNECLELSRDLIPPCALLPASAISSSICRECTHEDALKGLRSGAGHAWKSMCISLLFLNAPSDLSYPGEYHRWAQNFSLEQHNISSGHRHYTTTTKRLSSWSLAPEQESQWKHSPGFGSLTKTPSSLASPRLTSTALYLPPSPRGFQTI